MLKDVIAVEPLDAYCVRLRFEDQAEGIVDLGQLLPFIGVFAPLQDRAYFALVRVDPELGTIAWPNGADLDPDMLYAHATGQPLPTFESPTTLPANS